MDITEKNYKKLSIEVSLKGLSFCCFDTLSNTISSFKDILFDNNSKIEDTLNNIFRSNPELNERYDDVLVIHSNNLSTFVPIPLFDENYLGSYLQYNTKVFSSDFFAFDEINNYDMNTVYIPYVNINNFFIDKFGEFDYKHANSILVAKLLDSSRNNDDKKMIIHFKQGHFEIAVIQNQKLLLFNSFEYQTPEDFIYYILFVAEQLNMNPENLPLELIGDITKESEFYKIAYKYVRNVSFIEVEDLKANNSFSEAENRNHFILFNS